NRFASARSDTVSVTWSNTYRTMTARRAVRTVVPTCAVTVATVVLKRTAVGATSMRSVQIPAETGANDAVMPAGRPAIDTSAAETGPCALVAFTVTVPKEPGLTIRDPGVTSSVRGTCV